MKKVTFIMALAVGAGLASCTAQSPKANLKTDVDSLSYAIGMARTEGLTQYKALTLLRWLNSSKVSTKALLKPARKTLLT